MKTKKNDFPKHQYLCTGNTENALISKVRIGKLMRRWNPLPLYPYIVEESERRNRIDFSEKFCRFCIISVLLDGQLLYESEGRKFLLKKGMLIVIPPKTSYGFNTFTTGGYHKIVVEFGGPMLESFSAMLGIDKVTMKSVNDLPVLLDNIDRLKKILQIAPVRIPELLGTGVELLSRVAKTVRSDERTNTLLERAKLKLGSDLAQQLSVEDVAESLGMSSSSLERLFHRELRLTPRTYRNCCRIELARELLLHSDLSVKEIADRTGYCNQFHFTSEFKKHSGQTPSEFRKP